MKIQDAKNDLEFQKRALSKITQARMWGNVGFYQIYRNITLNFENKLDPHAKNSSMWLSEVVVRRPSVPRKLFVRLQ